jgi:hypothetical protein
MSVAATTGSRRRRPSTKAHKAAVKIYFVLCALVIGVALFPIRYTSLRMAMVGGIFALWAGALFLFWDRLFVRILCLLAAVAAGALVLLPTRSIDTDSLRSEYIRSLKSYEGTAYVWGGETKLGIDCSGLIRAGLIDAEIKEALRSQNFVLLRKAASLWWNDFSAKAMSDEYQGRTHKLGEFESINEIDYSLLQPGDLAVTGGTQHILAYTGDKTWIEADPKAMKVLSVKVPSEDGWFIQKAILLRWRILEPTPPTVEPR